MDTILLTISCIGLPYILADPELQEEGKFLGVVGAEPHWRPGAKPLVKGSEADDIFLLQRLISLKRINT